MHWTEAIPISDILDYFVTFCFSALALEKLGKRKVYI
jgi:hypothetical protein